MTDEEAEAALKELSKHFRQPVMPIGRYCKGLRDWQTALHARADRLKEELYPGLTDPDWNKTPEARERAEKALEAYRADMAAGDRWQLSRREGREMTERDHRLQDLREYESRASAVDDVFLQISKSALLDRLLYGGEPVRTKPCPEHKGRWSGLEFGENMCPHGCQLTGWLPEGK